MSNQNTPKTGHCSPIAHYAVGIYYGRTFTPSYGKALCYYVLEGSRSSIRTRNPHRVSAMWEITE